MDFGLHPAPPANPSVSFAWARCPSSDGSPIPNNPEYPTCSISRRVMPIEWRCPGIDSVMILSYQAGGLEPYFGEANNYAIETSRSKGRFGSLTWATRIFSGQLSHP